MRCPTGQPGRFAAADDRWPERSTSGAGSDVGAVARRRGQLGGWVADPAAVHVAGQVDPQVELDTGGVGACTLRGL
jgi:hypothetical protein